MLTSIDLPTLIIELQSVFQKNKNNTTRLIAKRGYLVYVTRKSQLSNGS